MKNENQLLQVEGICKSFGETKVLQDVSFSVAKGEVVSLVGRSGAGKTTALRCVMGLEHLDKGSIFIDGRYLCKFQDGHMQRASKKEIHDIRQSLGMVFQNYHLFPHKTVLENVTLALTEVYQVGKQEAVQTATAFLKRLDMGDKLQNKPYELSGGQKQRVAIARSCVTNPKLLCFDEPTAALDSSLVLDIIHIIRDLAKEGMGILIISHDEKFVRDVSDRVLFMADGKIIQEMDTEAYKEVMRD